MTAVKALEYRITRRLLRRRAAPERRAAPTAEWLIATAAIAAGLVLLASYLQSLLCALLLGGVILTLGLK